MSVFTSFVEWLFSALSDFLMSEPIIYIVCMVIALFAVKIIVSFISVAKWRV